MQRPPGSFLIQMDLVADWSKDASRILEVLPIEKLIEFKELFMSLGRLDNQCVHVLGNAMSLVSTDYEKALNACFRVEHLEEKIDLLYIEVLKVTSNSNLEPRILILVNELARSLEMIADSCEDTTDLIQTVIMSAFL